MAISLDALLIAGGGAVRGYRSSQELQRQIVEAKRKALLEEREAKRHEAALALQERLGSSQIESEGLARDKSSFELGEARKRSLEESEPLPQGSLRGRLLGLGLPNRYGTVTNPQVGSLLERILSEEGATGRDIRGYKFKTENPELSGGSRRTPKTPEERKSQYLLDTINAPTPFEDVDDYKEALRARLEFLQEQDPDAFGIKPSKKELSNDPAGIGGFLKPKSKKK